MLIFNCKYIESKRIDKKTEYIEFIKSTNIRSKYDLLLDNVYKLKIRTEDYKYLLEVSCFINVESLNIISRTCKLTNNYLYDKKLKFINDINKNLTINATFKKEYVKNLSISDLLLTNHDLKKKLLDDYERKNSIFDAKLTPGSTLPSNNEDLGLMYQTEYREDPNYDRAMEKFFIFTQIAPEGMWEAAKNLSWQNIKDLAKEAE